MRRIGILLAVATATLLAAASAWAGARQIRDIDISATFPSPFLSAACGTPVTVSWTGTVDVTLVTDRSGAVVREIDTTPGSFQILASSATGESFRFPNRLVFRFDYGDGAELGGTATVTATGLLGHVTGEIASDAGRIEWTGVVFGFSPEGIPIVDFGEPDAQTGNRESEDDVIAAICAALS